ncbi:hypothetical protein I7I50_07138 [Histoplasma capsulatum G186AR]|uniref:Uncharacterized protein n=1 Tax=Ajellomyces capsulatus TaxID=5037 RepID=A0A8H8D3G3_AJECA|nr:hypothetical protein I7I52_09809 [Histoplasma capsulatum]QSS67918.1 hypothetical protein I7I50_07138 [Histoplasma capsulatum G186AR]
MLLLSKNLGPCIQLASGKKYCYRRICQNLGMKRLESLDMGLVQRKEVNHRVLCLQMMYLSLVMWLLKLQPGQLRLERVLPVNLPIMRRDREPRLPKPLLV